MKNVIYINCWADPWIQVAKRLQEEYDMKPVWWIGYSKEDNSDVLVPQAFPDIVYQDNADAWKGRFSDDIIKKSENCHLDFDYLKKHAHQELQAIKMMDRVDQDRRSFNFMERQRHYRNMIKKCKAAIEIFKPSLVISTAIPHRFYDYVLYWLCQDLNIPFLTIQHTQFPGRFYFSKNSFYSLGNRFVEDYQLFEKQDNIESIIPNDILSRFNSVKKDYSEAAPAYMASLALSEKKQSSVFYLIKRTVYKFFCVYGPYLLGKPADNTIVGLSAYGKRANKKYEDSDGNIYQNIISLIQARRYKRRLKNYYETISEKPNYAGDKYVIYFLHYQPEATSCPGGDIFVDQNLCIETLLKNLPKSYMVYVKEHPHQFINGHIGETSRMKDFYDDLKKNDRVKLISTNEDTFNLIKHAEAVSTITGTVGWEAIVRHKPVIAFGLGWYENYSRGCLRITDEKSAERILPFIEGYEFNEHSLLAYLASVGKNTRLAYYFKKMYERESSVNEDECVNNIIASIIESYSK